mmetsp:Transcript_14435/g.35230  ORF Transcript_14435/g.35230 Transcript_14435/m.35230 type:complete len:236 (+) Transcript_14435:100-807(+)
MFLSPHIRVQVRRAHDRHIPHVATHINAYDRHGEGCTEAASTARALPRTLRLMSSPHRRRRRRTRRLPHTRTHTAARALAIMSTIAHRQHRESVPHTTRCRHHWCLDLQRLRSGRRSVRTRRCRIGERHPSQAMPSTASWLHSASRAGVVPVPQPSYDTPPRLPRSSPRPKKTCVWCLRTQCAHLASAQPYNRICDDLGGKGAKAVQCTPQSPSQPCAPLQPVGTVHHEEHHSCL